MTALGHLHGIGGLVARWTQPPHARLLSAPAPILRLPAPPVILRLCLVADAVEAIAEPPAAPPPVDTGPHRRVSTPPPDAQMPSSVAPAEDPDVQVPTSPPRSDVEPSEVHGSSDPWPPSDPPRVEVAIQVAGPNPWAIMPSRTLRGAGARHLIRKADPLEPAPTLQEKVESQGAEDPRPEATQALWDLLIVPAQTGFRASDQGVKALVLYLDRSQLLRSPTVSTLEEFVGHPLHQTEEHWRARLRGGVASGETRIITLEPGEFSHQIFFEGAAPAGPSSVQRGHIGQRPRPMAVPFGPEGREAAFWLALTGCRFERPSRGFLERLHSILYLRPQVFAVPHRPAPPAG